MSYLRLKSALWKWRACGDLSPLLPLGMLVTLVLAARAGAPTQSPPSPNMPVAGSYRVVAERWLQPSANFRSSVHLDMSGKKVRIVWKYSHSGVFNTAGGAVPDAELNQEVAVSFWPTAADAVAPSKILVAGKDRIGTTRIELWEIDAPTVKVGSRPAYSTPYELVAKSVRDMTLLYSAAVTGKDTVRGVISMRGSQTRALLQFHDSRDLYTLDWGNEPYPLTLFSSRASHPNLATDFDNYQGGDHADLGYTYLMGNMSNPDVGPSYLLRDSNRDGVIDSEGPLQAGDPLQLGRRDKYIEYGGLPWPP